MGSEGGVPPVACKLLATPKDKARWAQPGEGDHSPQAGVGGWGGQL